MRFFCVVSADVWVPIAIFGDLQRTRTGFSVEVNHHQIHQTVEDFHSLSARMGTVIALKYPQSYNGPMGNSRRE